MIFPFLYSHQKAIQWIVRAVMIISMISSPIGTQIHQAHTNEGLHTIHNLHDLESYDTQIPPKDSQAYKDHWINTVLMVQDLLLLVTLIFYIPDISSSYLVKILDFIKIKSEVWSKNDTILSTCDHPHPIYVSVSKRTFMDVLGLSEVSAETLLYSLSLTPSPMMYYDHLKSRKGYALTLLNPKAPYCMLLKHQNDLINQGIFNIKKFISPY